jgi:hypothetical protein
LNVAGHFGGLYEEARGDLWAALEDLWWLRGFLRRVGDEERGRVSTGEWAWGDPSFFGGDPTEVFRVQLTAVLNALGWGALRGIVDWYYLEEDEPEGSLAQLRRWDGSPVGAEHLSALAPWEEELLVAEISGPRDAALALRAELLRAHPGLDVFRWAKGSERAADLSPDVALVFLLPLEAGAWREAIHQDLMEKIVKAWEVRRERQRRVEKGVAYQARIRALRRGRARRGAPAAAGPAAARRTHGPARRRGPEDHLLRGPARHPRPLGRRRAAGARGGQELLPTTLARRRHVALRRGAPLRRHLRRDGRYPGG